MRKKDKEKSQGNIMEKRKRKKVEEIQEGNQKKAKKETEAERESRG